MRKFAGKLPQDFMPLIYLEKIFLRWLIFLFADPMKSFGMLIPGNSFIEQRDTPWISSPF